MDLDSTLGAIIAIFKVLDDAALTEGVEALGDSCGFDKISFTHIASDEMVKVLHKVLPG